MESSFRVALSTALVQLSLYKARKVLAGSNPTHWLSASSAVVDKQLHDLPYGNLRLVQGVATGLDVGNKVGSAIVWV